MGFWIAERRHRYKPVEDCDSPTTDIATITANTTTGSTPAMPAGQKKQFRLELFISEPPKLMGRKEAEAFVFVRPLGHLRPVHVDALKPYSSRSRDGARPWKFGYVLR
ncbi:MAG: hypothetical protein J3R72DRAFT_419432 [Linnemannia gamsii]|nr:MAG: hypothetical protein J3R72DRAFT_419432 [Linnemannia gamsii]